jgi:hypothetical protein
MTVTEPLPGNYGLANWVDYVNYWRESDAEWIQARANVRVADNTMRDGLSVTPGQVVYNAASDRLELRTAANAWRPQTPFPASLVVTEGATTTISHNASAGKGVIYGPTEVGINHQLNVLNGVLTVPADSSGVTIKTGAKTVKLSTSATDLVSDSPVSAPALTLSGTGTVLSAPGKAIAVGTITADTSTLGAASATTLAVSGVATMGGTLGVSGVLTANAGVVTNAAIHTGDASGAVIQQRNSGTGALGAAKLVVLTAAVETSGGPLNVRSGMSMYGGNVINYFDAGGTQRGNFAPHYYGADPGVGNVPEGSIWVS